VLPIRTLALPIRALVLLIRTLVLPIRTLALPIRALVPPIRGLDLFRGLLPSLSTVDYLPPRMETSTPAAPAKPKRWAAIVLAIFFLGAGHAYVGRSRRALVLWLGMLLLAAVGIAGHLATDAFWPLALLLPFVLARLVLLRDLGRFDPATFRTTPWWNVAGVAVLLTGANTLVGLGLRMLVIEAYRVPGPSMMPTLLAGDHMWATKLTYRERGPERGEVVVFASPENEEQDYVKRVVAVEGDRVEVRDGVLVINGWEVPRCKLGEARHQASGAAEQRGTVFVEWLHGRAYLVFHDAELTGPDAKRSEPYRVAPGEYFVLGDNRDNSYDSRLWFDGRGGGVPREKVKGRASLIWKGGGDDGESFGRIGIDLTDRPRLPSSMAALESDLARCLANAPSFAETIPPAPTSSPVVSQREPR